MLLKSDELAARLGESKTSDDPFVITPAPDLEKLKVDGSASVDLRLGCWFGIARHSRVPVFDVFEKGRGKVPAESARLKLHYVPFGGEFILQPRHFVLGVTLEWIRLPSNLAGYVIGKSSWGRHGLIIATATGVHPGFTGCLTLELSNVGEIPIAMRPGMSICQLFVHGTKSNTKDVAKSSFVGRRQPTLGRITVDEVAKRLAQGFGQAGQGGP